MVKVSNMHVKWRDHIVSTPDVLRGKPRVKGTRIPVSLVLGYLAAGKTAEEIIAEFPDLTREQIAACLDYARELAWLGSTSAEKGKGSLPLDSYADITRQEIAELRRLSFKETVRRLDLALRIASKWKK